MCPVTMVACSAQVFIISHEGVQLQEGEHKGLRLLTSVTAGLRWPPEMFAVQLQVYTHN